MWLCVWLCVCSPPTFDDLHQVRDVVGVEAECEQQGVDVGHDSALKAHALDGGVRHQEGVGPFEMVVPRRVRVPTMVVVSRGRRSDKARQGGASGSQGGLGTTQHTLLSGYALTCGAAIRVPGTIRRMRTQRRPMRGRPNSCNCHRAIVVIIVIIVIIVVNIVIIIGVAERRYNGWVGRLGTRRRRRRRRVACHG